MIASAALQQVIYTALSGQVAGTVWDEVPVDTVPPYTVIGEFTGSPDDSHTGQGSRETVTIHCWSAAKGNREVQQIMASIDARLHLAVLSGWLLKRLFAQVFRDQTGKPGETWRHGVLTYEATIEEA